MESIGISILFGLWGLAIAVLIGLKVIADAVRNRDIDVNVKLPTIKITSENSDAQ